MAPLGIWARNILRFHLDSVNEFSALAKDIIFARCRGVYRREADGYRYSRSDVGLIGWMGVEDRIETKRLWRPDAAAVELLWMV